MTDFFEREIWISPYRLKSKGFLNRLSKRREFEGVLIRMGEGYGCIHPWPELGDPSLEKCLMDLRGRRFWPIVRRALRCAEYDHVAREAQESLFEEMEVPRSHASLIEVNARGMESAVEAGFDVAKIKVGRDLVAESEFLESMAIAHPRIRWRLDFNEGLDPTSAHHFLTSLSSKLKMALDFIEDIAPFSEATWQELWKKHRVPLAVDREATVQNQAAQVKIIKPAVDEPFPFVESALSNQQRVVVTSYMDHPFGQAFAAWEAARMNLIFPGSMGICGLQTHHIFEKDAFVEELGEWKPEFKAPQGTGLGFDELLRARNWQKL